MAGRDVAALQPLRTRSHQLWAQLRQLQERAVHQWAQAERPGLKEHARSLRDTLSLLTAEEARLRQRVEALATKQLASDPSVSTGFNVIRSRTDRSGQPLSLEELQAERQRMVNALAQLNSQIAVAKAEVTRQRRKEDQEIWETQLVALQDTKRVYRDEINLVEVELLGREHSERINRERQEAEKSGAAQLQRLEDQILQTRIKLNRTKYQYYYPRVKGFNINFGGAGIYGACRNIDISEIHGYATLRAEVGSPATDTSPERPARLIIQVEAAKGGTGGQQTQQAQPEQQDQQQWSPGAQKVATPKPSAAAQNVEAAMPGLRRSATEPTNELPRDAAAVAARLQLTSMQPNGTSQQQQQTTARKPSQPQEASSSRPSQPAIAGGSSSTSAGGAVTEQLQGAHGRPALHQHSLPPLPSSAKAAKPSGNVAMRFLSRIGTKKDKYQSKDRVQLQPAPADDGEAGGKKKLRTLASKLLHRKSSRLHAGDFHSGGLDRLEFGGNRLGSKQDSRSSMLNDSIDEEASVQFSEFADDISETAPDDEAMEAPEGPGQVLEEGDGSIASSDDEEEGQARSRDESPASPLTQETLLQQVQQQQQLRPPNIEPAGSASSGPGSWLRGTRGAGSSRLETSSLADDASSMVSLGDWRTADTSEVPPGSYGKGVFVTGRVNLFELTGEKGTKCPNLSIGQADVRARVFCRFVFDYSTAKGWHKAEKPVFDVQSLAYKLKGNNVPMPSTLVRHLLRIFIPDIIHMRLLGLLPKELGDYLMRAQRGVDVCADVALVGPALAVLDADLAFEVRGPAHSTKEAKKQQHKYAAAKEARSLLGLSLPQAQVLGELFNGRSSLLEQPRPVSISSLIAFQAQWDAHPLLYDQTCQVWNTAYHMLAQGRRGAGDFHFREFMDTAVSRLRRKPARARVIVRSLDVGLNTDALVTMVHDYTQRALEELFIKGPQAHQADNPALRAESMEEQLEVLHAWHAFMLRELSHFKSKFRGASATLLGAGDKHGFSMGVENAHYEGPLRVRMPVNMQLDADGAFSFEIPLPSPTGAIGLFVDVFKSLVVPSHLRPPAAAVNWAELTGDCEVTADMQRRLTDALQSIQGVLDELNAKIRERGLEQEDADAFKVLTQPRTMVGDRLGRLIVSRLKVRVRLDERRIGEILQGIDSASMGPAFVSTAGRLLGHLGDVMTLGFTPAAPIPAAGSSSPGAEHISQYLFQFESSDISRLRADVQSLGFVSHVTPGGIVRLAHALVRAFLLAFKHLGPAELDVVRARFQSWYSNMTREGLELSICVDAKAGLEGGQCIVRLSGTADDANLRTTSPCVLTQDLDLVTLGKVMRGDFRFANAGQPTYLARRA